MTAQRFITDYFKPKNACAISQHSRSFQYNRTVDYQQSRAGYHPKGDYPSTPITLANPQGSQPTVDAAAFTMDHSPLVVTVKKPVFASQRTAQIGLVLVGLLYFTARVLVGSARSCAFFNCHDGFA